MPYEGAATAQHPASALATRGRGRAAEHTVRPPDSARRAQPEPAQAGTQTVADVSAFLGLLLVKAPCSSSLLLSGERGVGGLRQGEEFCVWTF